VRGAARLLPLLALLAGCVDFVDPAELGLARVTRMELTLELFTEARSATCSGAVPGGDSAVVCFRAAVDPGYSVLGARLRVLDDTLRLMGIPRLPSMDADSVLRYEGRFTLPNGPLEEIPIEARMPRVEGAEGAPEMRWLPLGRAGPDSLVAGPGEGASFAVELPRAASTPFPQSSWGMSVTGDTATATLNPTGDASGIPPAAFAFPAEVLETLGGPRYRAELRWFRTRVVSGEQFQLILRLNQRVAWIVTR